MARRKEPPLPQEYYKALEQVFELQSRVLTGVLPHAGERGRNDEERFREFLVKVLPRRFSIGTGFLVCSEKSVPQSSQTDVVICDEILNSPLHRELAAFVYPVEMVFGTVEIKGLLKPSDLRKSLEDIAKIRRLANHKRYLVYESFPVGQNHPGKTFSVRHEIHETQAPRAYLFAYDVQGWTSLRSFTQSLVNTTKRNGAAHLHGVAVLSRNWFSYQVAYTGSEPKFKSFSGNSLLRFVQRIIHDLNGIAMRPASIDRYLDLGWEAPSNQPLNADARPAGSARSPRAG